MLTRLQTYGFIIWEDNSYTISEGRCENVDDPDANDQAPLPRVKLRSRFEDSRRATEIELEGCPSMDLTAALQRDF